LKIPELTRFGVDSRLSLIKNNFNKLFITTGRKYFLGSNSKIKGTGSIYVKDCLDIGITGLHNIYETDHTIISCDGELIVNGHASIGKGSRVYIAKNATFTIGTNTYITGRATITVNKGVAIGDNCAIAWGLTLIDSDYHELKTSEGTPRSKSASISIGDNVWIGCNTTILKGVTIAKGVVVAANAVVNKSITEENVLVAGNPAQIVKRNINWQR
jgi:acetyltransferase-like isoleucine patch superfamily enzyme